MAQRDTPLFPLLVVSRNNDLKDSAPLLEKAGYTVAFAENEEAALIILEKIPCNIILFDQDSLEKETDDLWARLKTGKGTEARQVIFAVTDNSSLNEASVYASAVDEVIERPLNSRKLVFRIHRAKRVFLLEKALKQASRQMKQGAVKETEQRSALSMNMETLGRLAAGVIHEINTPVQYVGDNLHFLLDSVGGLTGLLDQCNTLCDTLDSGGDFKALAGEFKEARNHDDLDYLKEEIPESIRQSIQGVERISEIVLAIRNLSNQSQDNEMFVDIQKAVTSCTLVTRNEWKKNAVLETAIDEGLPEAVISPGAFSQVIINMIVNAAHALEDALNDDPNRNGLIKIAAHKDGDKIVIRVSDNGTGIPDDVLAKIFDPFFTTKKEGKGTGQGLAISKSIICDHKGTLDVETQPGKGTDFIIRLPAQAKTKKDESPARVMVQPRADEKGIRADGDIKRSILFIDDEIEILNGIKRMLHSMQDIWTMNFFQDGQDALNFLKNTSVDVAVSDFNMKGMNGIDFLTQVKAEYPHIVRIMLSGEINKSFIMKTVRIVHQFIAKPSDAETLKTTITRACDMKKLLINDDLRRAVANMDALPSLPTVYAEIIKELRSRDSSMKKVGQLIGQDTAMTTKILQLVNSAFFGLHTRVASPEQATMLLGIDTVKSLVLHYEIFSKINVNKSFRDFMESLAGHNLQTGHLAKRICDHEKADALTSDQAFMAGLLHDCGKLILASNFPKEYSKAIALSKKEGYTHLTAEQEVFNTSHSEVGAYLTGIWGFPMPLVNAIFHHHHPEKIEEQGMGPVTAVYIANLLSRGNQDQVNWEFLSKRGYTGRIDIWSELRLQE